MGTLIHAPVQMEMDDRILVHLETVIVNKFRRAEPFLLTWLESGSAEQGRRSLWLSPRHPIFFSYAGSGAPALDGEWLIRLQSAANTPRGLVVLGDDGQPAEVRTRI
ncbi:ATP-dependent DNA ligase [Humibacter sp. RRB41]|uniref:DUF7882 family protein n=1 Tax=Humibacter sp. RRB41 TaxID=2919946 RepID=UPI001FA98417|nr:ATP-dependent DNA ligase [Humibacter sp. RRB41]